MPKDLRYAARLLRKQPVFTLIAILTLALGIGATSAVLSLIQGVLLTSPYPESRRLVLIPAARSDKQKIARSQAWPAQQWLEWQQQAKSFEALAAYGWTFNFLILENGSQSLEGMWVTRDYFRVVGLQPILGRSFLPSETGFKPAPVIILGYEFWQRTFNGDPHIIGKTLRISRQDVPPKIIGVMPPGVRFLPSSTASQEPNYNVNALVDFWIPAAPDPARLKDPGWDVVARLRPAVPLAQAQSELSLITQRQAQADHDFAGIAPNVTSLNSEMNRDGRRILLPLLGAAALVLLIACGNAAALLLIRGLQRQQEYALRSALGVSRAALFRQVSIESLLVALAGGVVGIALALGIVKILKLIAGHAIPRLDAVTTGWPVLVAGLGSAVVAALLAGLLPALRAGRLDPMLVLRSAGPNSTAGRGERRLLRTVTTLQTALTLALLVGAGLLIRTMSNLSNVQSGYRSNHILSMTVTAVQGNWSDFHHRALERVASLPGVQHVAFAWGVPLTGNDWPGSVEIEGQPIPKNASDQITVPLRATTPGYFTLLGLALSEGRDFRSTDDHQAPTVAIVNQALVDRYFLHTNPVGKKLWIFGHRQPPAQIIGVVNNGRTTDLTQSATPEIYLSLWQASAFSKDLVVQTSADPRSITAAVQRELRAIDPTVAVENVKTLEQIRNDSQASRLFAMQLLVGFAIVGGALTLVGIYGVLSLSVTARRRELAIRAAIGADRRAIRNLVFAEGLQLILGGLIAGFAAALILARVLRSFLFEVQPNDPITLLSVAFLFTAVALLACWIPTRRAVRVNPVEALRYE